MTRLFLYKRCVRPWDELLYAMTKVHNESRIKQTSY